MEKFDERDLTAALEDLAMCEFFPSDEGTRAAVMRLLARMVPHREALHWLVRTFADRIGKWHGPAELRAVLCTRYQPADGIEGFSALPGFRPEDSEAKVFDEHEQRKVGWLAPNKEPMQISGDKRAETLIRGLLHGKVM